jgi:hypothetical protein
MLYIPAFSVAGYLQLTLKKAKALDGRRYCSSFVIKNKIAAT